MGDAEWPTVHVQFNYFAEELVPSLVHPKTAIFKTGSGTFPLSRCSWEIDARIIEQQQPVAAVEPEKADASMTVGPIILCAGPGTRPVQISAEALGFALWRWQLDNPNAEPTHEDLQALIARLGTKISESIEAIYGSNVTVVSSTHLSDSTIRGWFSTKGRSGSSGIRFTEPTPLSMLADLGCMCDGDLDFNLMNSNWNVRMDAILAAVRRNPEYYSEHVTSKIAISQHARPFKSRELQQELEQELLTSLNHAHSILPNECWSRQRLIQKCKEVGGAGVGNDAQLLDSIFEKLTSGGADSKNHINSSAAWKSRLNAIGPGQLIGLIFVGFIGLFALTGIIGSFF